MFGRVTFLLLLASASLPFAQETRSAEAAARFPQPVQVGTLAGRQVLENRLNQRVLGRVEAVARDPSGALNIVVRRGGWPWQATRCAVVPAAALALLGQFVVVMDLDDAQFDALPNECRAPGAVLQGSEIIRMGLTKN
jgi:hypothetical protein